MCTRRAEAKQRPVAPTSRCTTPWPSRGPPRGRAYESGALLPRGPLHLAQALIAFMVKYNARARPYTQATIDALGLPLDMLTDLQSSTTRMYIFEMYVHGSMMLVLLRRSVGSVITKKLIDSDVRGAHCVERHVQKYTGQSAAPLAFGSGPPRTLCDTTVASGPRGGREVR